MNQAAKAAISDAYRRAEAETGKDEKQLRRMAEGVLASILIQCMAAPGKYIWTAAKISAGGIELEVGVKPFVQIGTERKTL